MSTPALQEGVSQQREVFFSRGHCPDESVTYTCREARAILVRISMQWGSQVGVRVGSKVNHTVVLGEPGPTGKLPGLF